MHIYVIHLTDSSKNFNATGVYCQKNADQAATDTSLRANRPTVGLLKYNTYHIIDQSNKITNRVFSTITATTIHEFIQILGIIICYI